MSLFKRLTSLFTANQSSNLVECTGYFYHYHKNQWICLFNDCELVIHRVGGEFKFNFQIQVTRIVDEQLLRQQQEEREENGGDDSLDENKEQEDDNGEDNYFEFPITTGLELFKETGPLGHCAYSWKGTNNRFMFEFDENESNDISKQNRLRRVICECIYESKYHQSASTGSDNEIDNFCRETQTVVLPTLTTSVTTIEAVQPMNISSDKVQQQQQEEQQQQSMYNLNELKEITTATSTATSAQPTTIIQVHGEQIYKQSVALYLETNEQFNLKDAAVDVVITKTKSSNPIEYQFYIINKSGVPILAQPVDSNMFHQFFNEQSSFIWYDFSTNEDGLRWSIKFSNEQEYDRFREQFTIYHFESANQTKFKGKKDEVEFLAQQFTEDVDDPNIVFDTDDGFNAKDLEDFDNMTLDDDVNNSQEFINESFEQADEEEEEEEEGSEEEEEEGGSEEEEGSEEGSGEEEEGSEEEEEPESEEQVTPIKVKTQPKVQDSDEEEEESEEEEEEESEEEEEEESEGGTPVKPPYAKKRPVIQPSSSEEEESEEEEEESEEESESEQEKTPIKTPIKRRPVIETSSEEEESEEDEDQDESDDSDLEEIQADPSLKQISKDFKNAKNSSLVVGYKDRSYVVRGSTIGVFNTGDNDLKFNTAITNIKSKDKQHFSPKKIMLQQQDQSLLMLNPERTNNVYKIDLNRPDIVEEWDLKYKGQPTAVKSIMHEKKNDETTNKSTFVGYSGNSMFLVDPRQKTKNVAVKFTGGSNPRSFYTCAATSDSGHLAIGTDKGEIKMFSQTQFDTSKRYAGSDDPLGPVARSRTTLPGIGDPVIGVDVTKDGKWIVATCKQYLMIIPAELKDGSIGFEDRLGARKPVPKRLVLKSADIKRMGGVVNFTPAKFNTVLDANTSSSETFIVTSSGRFLITWNFRKCKQNIFDVYQMKEYKSDIVAEQFKCNRDNSIVVTFPDNVVISNKK